MSARAAQVERVLGMRKRQVEQALRAAAWLEENNDGRTHHGYGLCVKDHKHYCTCEPEDRFDWSHRCKCGYELTREGFWQDAEHIGGEHGFDVCSAGRSGGWLIVRDQPNIDDMWEEEQREWHERFAAFALDIEELLRTTGEAYDKGLHVSGEKLADILSQAEAEARAYD